MLILNTSWMRNYNGVSKDTPVGKFEFMKTGGVPHEVYNFEPVRGRYYGYAPVKNGSINIQRLGAAGGANSIAGQDVVWTATHPSGGRYIVGWYRNATVLAEPQLRPSRKQFSYSVTAAQKDSRLLSLDERAFRIPTMKKGFPGISSSFFADDLPPSWRRKLATYLMTGPMASAAATGGQTSRSADPERRAAVELAAVRAVTRHYKSIGFRVVSRERDNVGWDLDAIQGEMALRLEVKGCSGHNIAVEVTPNEYSKMNADKFSYRLCVITDALAKPTLQIFAYDEQTSGWADEKGRLLKITPRTGAVIRLA